MVDLSPELLLCAYASGVFPMADDRDDPTIQWIDPHLRGILPLDAYHVPKSLQKTIRQQRFEVKSNTAFERVIRACAESSPDRPRTWLNDELIDLYCDLHNQRYAHSVECWRDNDLVGGLYGLSLGGGLFWREHVFAGAGRKQSRPLVDLIGRLKQGGYQLLDIQFVTDHLIRFGAIEIPRQAYLRRLKEALLIDAVFHSDAGDIVSSTPLASQSRIGRLFTLHHPDVRRPDAPMRRPRDWRRTSSLKKMISGSRSRSAAGGSSLIFQKRRTLRRLGRWCLSASAHDNFERTEVGRQAKGRVDR